MTSLSSLIERGVLGIDFWLWGVYPSGGGINFYETISLGGERGISGHR